MDDLLLELDTLLRGVRPDYCQRLLPGLADDELHLCLDLEGSFTGNPGQLVRFWHDDAQRPIEAPDLEAWLRWYLASVREAADERDDPSQPVDVEFGAPSIPGYPIRTSAEAG